MNRTTALENINTKKIETIIFMAAALAILSASMVFKADLDLLRVSLFWLSILMAIFVILKPYYGTLLIFLATVLLPSDFVHDAQIVLGGFPLDIVDFLFLCVLASWLAHVPFKLSKNIKDNALLGPFIVFFILCVLLPVYTGVLNRYGMWEVGFDFHPFLYYFIFFFSLSFVDTKEKIRKFIFCALLALLYYSGSCYYRGLTASTAGGIDPVTQLELLRFGGAFHPIIFIMAMSMYLFTKSKRLKFIFFLLAFIGLSLNFFSFTRGRWFGAAVGAMFLFWNLYTGKKLRMFILGFLLIVSFIMFAPFFSSLMASQHQNLLTAGIERLLNSFTNNEINVSYYTRVKEIQMVWPYIVNSLESFLFGNGFGATFVYYSPDLLQYFEGGYVHNNYIYLLYHCGLIGLLAFLYLVIAYIKKGLSVFRKESDPFFKAFTLGCVSSIVSLLATSIVSPEFIYLNMVPYIAIVMGMTITLDRLNR